MKFYFSLQFQMLKRNLIEFGVNPYLGFLISLIAFVGFSFLLFFKTIYAPYIYLIIALSLIVKFGETRRNDFLKSSFSSKNYRLIRAIENATITLPFVVFLGIKNQWIEAIFLFSASIIFSLINFKDRLNFTIPTPFSKRPFEFAVGFRRIYLVFFLAYFLNFMAIAVGNFSLGLFSILAIFVACMTFYGMIETEFYVWIYALTAREFLLRKIRTALLYSTILIVPNVISLIFFFPTEFHFVIIIMILGYLYLINMILSKYSAYPEPMNLPHAIIFGISVTIPPFLVFIIPFFLKKALKNLKHTLE